MALAPPVPARPHPMWPPLKQLPPHSRNWGKRYRFGTQAAFLQVKNLEVLSGYRIFIALPEKAHVVRVFQLFDPHRIAPELLYVATDRAGILHTAMDQLFFPIPLDLECDARRNRGGCNGEHGYEQHQHEQNVAA